MNTNVAGASVHRNPSFVIDVSAEKPALGAPSWLTQHLLDEACLRAATNGIAGYREAGNGPLVIVKKSRSPKQFVVDILQEPAVAGLPPLSLLQDLFGLTATESQIARNVARGENAQDIAKRFNISRNTARVHVQRVLAKTGCHRQSQLGALLYGLRSVVDRT